MDDQDNEDYDYRPGDPYRYYYVMGMLSILLNVFALIVSAVPFSLVRKTGCVLVIIFSFVWLFYATQVHSQSIGSLVHPDCFDLSGTEKENCSGDKINFVATWFFAWINVPFGVYQFFSLISLLDYFFSSLSICQAMQVAYAFAFINIKSNNG
jgi:hypothetical protein